MYASIGLSSARFNTYGPDIDPVLDEMERTILAEGFLTGALPARWTALKYLESDGEVMKTGKEADPDLSSRLEKMTHQVEVHVKKTLDACPWRSWPPSFSARRSSEDRALPSRAPEGKSARNSPPPA